MNILATTFMVLEDSGTFQFLYVDKVCSIFFHFLFTNTDLATSNTQYMFANLFNFLMGAFIAAGEIQLHFPPAVREQGSPPGCTTRVCQLSDTEVLAYSQFWSLPTNNVSRLLWLASFFSRRLLPSYINFGHLNSYI